MAAGPDSDGDALPHRLGVAFTRLALARLTGDSTSGVELARQSRDLLAQLPIRLKDERAEMSLLVDANLGSLQASMGSFHEAAHTLTRGVHQPARLSGYGARVDCEGQLALIEAYQGDLRSAIRRATLVLSGASRSAQSGAMHACTALALVHVERGDLEQAREYLDLASAEFGGHEEPWLATSRLLAETRLLTDDGRPEAATRLLADAGSTGASTSQNASGLSDLLTIASVEALVAAGEPQRALALVTSGLARAEVAAAVLTTAARWEIGDLRGARAALAKVAASDLPGAPLDLQIQSWLLEARLAAQADGNAERARLLIDRALRAGGVEEMRRPFMHQWHWLRGFLDRDVSLMQEHRGFLASVQPRRSALPKKSITPARSGRSAVGTLTERERQVLELLAQMYSTDEIAGALFVSANTVKTHLKGVFSKLGVNRRADAVRQGRELGLC
jgi:LuxR family maltose regulon positive regulatory protein